MSDELSENIIDYLLSCLEIAKNLDIEDDSLKHNSPFPEIGPVEIYRDLNAGLSVEFKPKGWEHIDKYNFPELSGYVSAAMIKNEYIGGLRGKQNFKEDGTDSYSLVLEKPWSSSYLFKIDRSGVRVYDEKGANIFIDAYYSFKKNIDKNMDS
ncbi:MAG: hypothetical protein KAS90_00620 [Candidatus Aenigmarchaeota archaeon]|nr:hypothetical protein [Candidatus Aenigmarchaeota archaeon]